MARRELCPAAWRFGNNHRAEKSLVLLILISAWLVSPVLGLCSRKTELDQRYKSILTTALWEESSFRNSLQEVRGEETVLACTLLGDWRTVQTPLTLIVITSHNTIHTWLSVYHHWQYKYQMQTLKHPLLITNCLSSHSLVVLTGRKNTERRQSEVADWRAASDDERMRGATDICLAESGWSVGPGVLSHLTLLSAVCRPHSLPRMDGELHLQTQTKLTKQGSVRLSCQSLNTSWR